MLSVILLVVVLAVAYFNGANDVSKAVATLVGGGVAPMRTAILWGSLWTFAGAVAAALLSHGLVTAFSGGGLLESMPRCPDFMLSVAAGTLAWIWLATLTGLPVSTTHALTGSLVGAGAVAAGFSGIHWPFLLGKFALPLAASPLMSFALVGVVLPVTHSGMRRWKARCLCVQQPVCASISSDAAVSARTTTAGTAVVVFDEVGSCARSPAIVAGVTVLDALHWLSSGATAFARGLNDAPKVLGLGLLAATALHLPLPWAFLLIALAMAGGSLLRGLRVTETLARKVTPMAPLEGCVANAVTSVLVILASTLALPVSTTHVSSAAIIGLGVRRDARQVRWNTVRNMVLAWLVTIPAAGLIAALAYSLLR